MPKQRSARSWSRDDAVLVLAAYFDRPARSAIPAATERQRLANLTRHSVETVTRHCGMFASLDPDNRSEGVAPGAWEQKLWERYADDRLACMLEADRIVDAARRLPSALRRN